MSVDMNKTIAEASLDNLHDIIVPNAVGFFPLAPGWNVVICLLLTLLMYLAWKKYKHHRATLYKYEALKELDAYAKESKSNALALLALAKRVGMAAYGRQRIAKLSGDKWWHFMEAHSEVILSKDLRAEMDKLLYSTGYALHGKVYDDILQSVTLWVKTHRKDEDV